MPVDPIIARGIEAPDLTRPLLLAEEIKNRRQYNKLLELDRQFRERSYQDEQVQLQQQQTQEAQQRETEAKKQAELDDIRQTYHLIKSGDPAAFEYAYMNAPQQFRELRKRAADPKKADDALMGWMASVIGAGSDGTGQPYTLAPGSARYDASGNLVAERPFAPPSPPNYSVIQLPGGQGAFNPRTAEVTPLSSRTDQREQDAADAAATTAAQEGAKAEAAKGSKKGPQAGLNYIVNQRFMPLLEKGYRNYGGMREFSNLRQQLSTELRTLFRIPGEGTLSDKEQAQYGLQLPSVLNPDELNKQILADIQNRVALRLGEQPTSGAAPDGGLTPEERAELEALRKQFGRPQQ